MTPAERTAKITELRAEADRLEREGKFIDSILPPLTIDWCKEIWRKCERGITVGAAVKWVIEQDRARITIKTPDAPEPTGAELVGKYCEYCGDKMDWDQWGKGECASFDPSDITPYKRKGDGTRFRHARLYREDRP